MMFMYHSTLFARDNKHARDQFDGVPSLELQVWVKLGTVLYSDEIFLAALPCPNAQ